MVSIKVHFGNNNTLTIKVEETLLMSALASVIALILGKSETDVLHLIFDGVHVTDPSRSISDYIKMTMDQHVAHIIWRPAASMNSFMQPVPVVIDDPSAYLVETTDFFGTCCTYCTMEMTEEESIAKIIKCHHAFHKTCITQWLSEVNVHCPFCNCDVRQES